MEASYQPTCSDPAFLFFIKPSKHANNDIDGYSLILKQLSVLLLTLVLFSLILYLRETNNNIQGRNAMSTTSTEQKTVRVIWKCRYLKCKHIWAYDYLIDERFREHNEYRLLEDGSRQYLFNDIMNDLHCPECGGNLPNHTRVIGHYSPGKKCNSRCLNATGGDCDCQCAGKMHGANHL